MARFYRNSSRLAEELPKGNHPVLVVGSGIFGSVVAERLAADGGRDVFILEKRDHIGGNSYSAADPETGIDVHRYGSHIFHTKSEKVWNYISRFTRFNTYRHKVLTTSGGRVYAMPISLMTINAFFEKNLKPDDIDEFLAVSTEQFRGHVPANLEEKAISLIGEDLYRAFIKGYTEKQWGRPATELPAEIITRLPVRRNYNIDYFNDTYQGIPLGGYGKLFEKLLAHPKIHVFLNTDYFDVRDQLPDSVETIWTGPVDQLLGFKYGYLEWRSLRFEWETIPTADWQGTAVMNYADREIPWTRIHEFKHYHPEREEVFLSQRTVICREYPVAWQPGNEPYYPINDTRNQKLHQRYANEIAQKPGWYLGGRLGAYQYWDMDQAILKALELSEKAFHIGGGQQ
ncbi:MAG: UDP-galactopyranose mutase [Thermoguttaceae bacterium]|nr:UDP-galactopyranose mutase [Thermoguttaceae bacterium]